VVDGYGWPIGGIFDFNWPEKTKYRVDPGFYDAEVSLFINLKKWQGLTAKQRDFLQQQVINFEGRNDFWKAYAQEETKRQAAAGIKTISFDAATAAAYRKQAYDTGWAGVIKNSPQHGPAMQKLFTKK
jgi:TRAP-type transport system periplasmic protein